MCNLKKDTSLDVGSWNVSWGVEIDADKFALESNETWLIHT